jgi:molybdate transport system ATP-binding protein
LKPSLVPSRPFLSLRGVAIRCYDRILFAGTDWEMRSDQHWAILGPNGSGKTTLVKAICGRVPVVQGHIEYHFGPDGMAGHSAGALTRPEAAIAHVSFEGQYSLLAHQSPFYQARWNSHVGETAPLVSEYLSQERVRPADAFTPHSSPVASDPTPPDLDPAFPARIQDVIDLLQIGHLLDRSVIQLSSGEMRKTLIARALLRNPRLLILDNPFTGLDTRFRARLKDVIRQLMQGEMRIMVVTTRPDEIPLGITHILRVEQHRVVAQGTRKAVLGQELVDDGRPEESALATDAAGEDYSPSYRRDRRKLTADGRPTTGKEGECAHSPDGQRSTVVGPRSAVNGQAPVLVRMRHVTVSYGDVQVLHGISWTIRRGDKWALLGPNGSGKTTLLSLILGDNPQAYANDITLFGRRRGSGESIWEIKQHIGWVAPELLLHYPRDVRCLDVVCSGFFDSVGLYRRPTAGQRREAQRWIERLSMGEHTQTPLAALSEGEQRLALVARALVKEPWLLILDEPCQGLDAGHRRRVLDAVATIGRQPDATLIYVTHQDDELLPVITHVLRLKRAARTTAEEGRTPKIR